MCVMCVQAQLDTLHGQGSKQEAFLDMGPPCARLPLLPISMPLRTQASSFASSLTRAPSSAPSPYGASPLAPGTGLAMDAGASRIAGGVRDHATTGRHVRLPCFCYFLSCARVDKCTPLTMTSLLFRTYCCKQWLLGQLSETVAL